MLRPVRNFVVDVWRLMLGRPLLGEYDDAFSDRQEWHAFDRLETSLKNRKDRRLP